MWLLRACSPASAVESIRWRLRRCWGSDAKTVCYLRTGLRGRLRGRLCGDNRALFGRDGALSVGELFCLLLEAFIGLGMSKNLLTWDSTTPQGI